MATCLRYKHVSRQEVRHLRPKHEKQADSSTRIATTQRPMAHNHVQCVEGRPRGRGNPRRSAARGRRGLPEHAAAARTVSKRRRAPIRRIGESEEFRRRHRTGARVAGQGTRCSLRVRLYAISRSTRQSIPRDADAGWRVAGASQIIGA
ncbi:hypothetical protein EXIGLDRAFT_499766 [Exidia glandulosa HHB12029]|uniref:Uncharacterized protein n=1 Tax=Exidia glandulosa HHB12029 TaxID=1314781 RepID=A0A166N786_EXIGL|nr:hypothetical protein EXIGLDRAFT_499766 [Exidia glandulosa HHB12029]